MSGPVTVKLADICDVRSGGTPPRSNAKFYGGAIPWAKISDLETDDGTVKETEESITEAGLAAIRGRLFEPGTLLFAIYGSIGKMALATCRLSTNQAILGITVRSEEKVDQKFLYHWLAYRKDELLQDGQGIAQKNLSAAYLRDLEIPLPPLGEQRRIAAILDKADALRRKRKRALDLLDGLTQSIFLEMFGDTDDNPRGLPVVELDKLIASGPTNGLYKPSSAYGNGTPILRINNFYDGAIVDQNELLRLYVSEVETSRFHLKKDDIVINRVNSREYVGKSALIPQLTEPTVFESNMMRFRVRHDVIRPVFCIQALQTKATWRQIQAKTKDAINQSSINQQDVRSIRLPIPSLDLQDVFVRIAQSASTLRETHRANLGAVSSFFASLQFRAFEGTI